MGNLHVRTRWIVLCLLVCSPLYADTVLLKNGQELKGLVVEKHEDRVILSTEKGEMPVLKDTIQAIRYDDPEQNFMQLGEANEAVERWAEALAYYEKALEANPDFGEAKKAQVRVRNRFWSKAAAGPKNEIERRQLLYDSWGTGGTPGTFSKSQAGREQVSLRDGLGVELERKGDWTQLAQVFPQKDAASAGLKKQDRLVAIDGRSIRYLSPEAVQQKFLSPRYSNFTLEYERDCPLMKTGFEKEFAEFGLELKLEHEGVVVQKVEGSSPASRASLKVRDLLVAVNGKSIRYVPLTKLMGEIQSAKNDTVVLSVRRSAILTRR